MNAFACASPCPTLVPEEARQRVEKLQRRIAKAQREGRFGRVKALSRLLRHSHAAREAAATKETFLRITAFPFWDKCGFYEWLHRTEETNASAILSLSIKRRMGAALPCPISLNELFASFSGALFVEGDRVYFAGSGAAHLEDVVCPAICASLARNGYLAADAKVRKLADGAEVGAMRLTLVRGALRVEPSAEACRAFKRAVRSVVHRCRGTSQRTLILRLNACMLAWSRAQRPVGTLKPYRALDSYLQCAIRRWMKRSYANKGAAWRRERCYHRWGKGMYFSTSSPIRGDALCLLSLTRDVIKPRMEVPV